MIANIHVAVCNITMQRARVRVEKNVVVRVCFAVGVGNAVADAQIADDTFVVRMRRQGVPELVPVRASCARGRVFDRPVFADHAKAPFRVAKRREAAVGVQIAFKADPLVQACARGVRCACRPTERREGWGLTSGKQRILNHTTRRIIYWERMIGGGGRGSADTQACSV